MYGSTPPPRGLDQLRSGVEEQLLIFSSCLSPWRVKKFQKFINFCLKVGHSANLKHSKSTWRQSSCDSCEMYKISTSRSRNGNNLRQLSPLISGAFVCSRLIYEKCLHLSDKFAYRSAHNNLFLTPRVIHKLKMTRNNWCLKQVRFMTSQRETSRKNKICSTAKSTR